jgi:hypothetical protein
VETHARKITVSSDCPESAQGISGHFSEVCVMSAWMAEIVGGKGHRCIYGGRLPVRNVLYIVALSACRYNKQFFGAGPRGGCLRRVIRHSQVLNECRPYPLEADIVQAYGSQGKMDIGRPPRVYLRSDRDTPVATPPRPEAILGSGSAPGVYYWLTMLCQPRPGPRRDGDAGP